MMLRGKDWKINNKWKYYYMTYKETVILDTDMIFPRCESLVGYLSEKDIWACTNVKTYRGEKVVDLHYSRRQMKK